MSISRNTAERLGIFLTSGDVARWRSAEKAAADLDLLARARVRHASIWCASYDGRRATLATVQRTAALLRSRGIVPHVWAFPSPRDARAIGEHLAACARSIGAPLAICDVEDPDGRGPLDWSDDDADAFLGATVDGVTEATMVAVSSYPYRRGHGLPWERLEVGAGSPQIYSVADEPAKAHAAREDWRAVHGLVIPATSLSTPGTGGAIIPAAQIVRRLDAVARDPRTGVLVVDAVLLWSSTLLRLAGRAHVEAISAWCEGVGW